MGKGGTTANPHSPTLNTASPVSDLSSASPRDPLWQGPGTGATPAAPGSWTPATGPGPRVPDTERRRCSCQTPKLPSPPAQERSTASGDSDCPGTSVVSRAALVVVALPLEHISGEIVSQGRARPGCRLPCQQGRLLCSAVWRGLSAGPTWRVRLLPTHNPSGSERLRCPRHKRPASMPGGRWVGDAPAPRARAGLSPMVGLSCCRSSSHQAAYPSTVRLKAGQFVTEIGRTHRSVSGHHHNHPVRVFHQGVQAVAPQPGQQAGPHQGNGQQYQVNVFPFGPPRQVFEPVGGWKNGMGFNPRAWMRAN